MPSLLSPSEVVCVFCGARIAQGILGQSTLHAIKYQLYFDEVTSNESREKTKRAKCDLGPQLASTHPSAGEVKS